MRLGRNFHSDVSLVPLSTGEWFEPLELLEHPTRPLETGCRSTCRTRMQTGCGGLLGANVVNMVARGDPFRPTWTIRSPSGQRLTVEFDRLRSHWRVGPGEYVRRQLVDALAQATGSRPESDWIVKVAHELSAQLPGL